MGQWYKVIAFIRIAVRIMCTTKQAFVTSGYGFKCWMLFLSWMCSWRENVFITTDISCQVLQIKSVILFAAVISATKKVCRRFKIWCFAYKCVVGDFDGWVRWSAAHTHSSLIHPPFVAHTPHWGLILQMKILSKECFKRLRKIGISKEVVQCVKTLLKFGAFLAVCISFYSIYEGWTMSSSLAFAIVAMSSVGE